MTIDGHSIPLPVSVKRTVEIMGQVHSNLADALCRLKSYGYSVQLSTCRDTGVLAKNGGVVTWVCSIKSAKPMNGCNPPAGIRVRQWAASPEGANPEMHHDSGKLFGWLCDERERRRTDDPLALRVRQQSLRRPRLRRDVENAPQEPQTQNP